MNSNCLNKPEMKALEFDHVNMPICTIIVIIIIIIWQLSLLVIKFGSSYQVKFDNKRFGPIWPKILSNFKFQICSCLCNYVKWALYNLFVYTNIVNIYRTPVLVLLF